MNEKQTKVQKRLLEDEMGRCGEILLKYSIAYPQFWSRVFRDATARMNQFYRSQALKYQKYCREILFKIALEQYENSLENGFPIRTFEAMQDFTVTYNKNCYLSLYFDRYEYAGGAHGGTVRTSDTWNLESGYRIALGQLFPLSFEYRKYIISTIIHQIEEQIEGGDNVFFDEYRKNVEENFDPSSFYTTEKGLVIYFQQYAIGPYSSGIIEFTI